MYSRSAATALLIGCASLVTACGPMSPETAARVCEERARAATGPTGSVSIGISNRGPSVGAEIGISNDYLQGRDPYVLYDQCVRQKSGQGPIRPLKLD